jgi:hypothetical protein
MVLFFVAAGMVPALSLLRLVTLFFLPGAKLQ